jgi:hypothetical protein
MKAEGNIIKMAAELANPIQYFFRFSDEIIPANEFLGKKIQLEFTHQINCVNCGRKTPKSFSQGFCYPCFANSPENAECIIHPELCRGHLGEGRDPAWELENHVQPHVVYLALSSGVKVGVTRSTQVPTRWIDQGASAAIELARTTNRYEAGVIEVALKKYMNDKTNWQKMLKGEVGGFSLNDEKEKAKNLIPEEFQHLYSENMEVTELIYPILSHPTKVESCSFDKTNTISGQLSGIKGQYLIFDDGRVLNLRNASGYYVVFTA